MADSKHDVNFVVGMRGPTVTPEQAQRMLQEFLRHEARLGTVVTRALRTRPLKPAPKLVRLVAQGRTGKLDEADDDSRELLGQVADLMDELKDRSGTLAEIEKLLAAEQGVAVKGSDGHKAAGECLALVHAHRIKLEKSVREVRLPKPSGVAARDLQASYAAASAILAAGVVADAAYKAIKRALGR